MDVDPVLITTLETRLEDLRSKVASLVIAGAGIVGLHMNEDSAQRRQETVETALSAMNTTYVKLGGLESS